MAWGLLDREMVGKLVMKIFLIPQHSRWLTVASTIYGIYGIDWVYLVFNCEMCRRLWAGLN